MKNEAPIAAASIKESQKRNKNRRRQHKELIKELIKTKNLNRVLKRVNAWTKYSRAGREFHNLAELTKKEL